MVEAASGGELFYQVVEEYKNETMSFKQAGAELCQAQSSLS